MKLHLPKLLRVALLATFVMPVMGVAFTDADIVIPEAGGDSYLNLGMENATDTWDGDLVVGDTDTTQGDVDKVGAFNDSWAFITPNGGKTNTTITSGLKVNGSLTLQGNGKIVIGGQYKGAGSYTGLEATESITVTGGTLTATKIITNHLIVNGGTISTSTGNCTSGNGFAGGPKQSHIKESLTINGGSLTFGYTSNVQGIGTGSHRMTYLQGTITQNGGTMKVLGDCDLQTGMTITQQDKGGLLVLRDTIFMNGSGTTTINQKANDAKLVLGRLEAKGSSTACIFDINQTAAGLIHMAFGSNFAKEATINLNQSGGGTIVIGGGHDTSLTGALPNRNYTEFENSPFEVINTTYNINQVNGTITVKKNGILNVGTSSIKGQTQVLKDGTLGSTYGDLEWTADKEWISKSSAVAPIKVESGSTGVVDMQDGSYFGISLTKAFKEGLTAETTTEVIAADNPLEKKLKFDFNVIALDGVDTTKLQNDFRIFNLDERLWSLENATWVHDDTAKKSYVDGTLVYDYWIELDAGGEASETFEDESDYLPVGLKISNKDIILSGSNKHSYGTYIDGGTSGITVTLKKATALGSGPLYVSGTCHIATGTVTATLPGTIQNSGTLTFDGKYKVAVDNMEIKGSVEDVLVGLDSQIGENGFNAEKSTRILVAQGTTGEMTFKEGSELTVGTGKLIFGQDTVVTGENVEIEAIETDKSIYYIKTNDHEVSAEAIQKGGNRNTTVDMADTAGTLTVDADIEVDAKGGTIKPQSGVAVSGSIAGAVIEGAGGIVDADLSGDNTLKGALELSGEGTTAGNLTLDGAELTLGATGALGSAAVSTKGNSTLKVAGDVEKATLTDTITNIGQLTMDGAYDVTDMTDVPLPDSYVDLSDQAGNNGFRHYDRFEVAVVSNKDGSGATLTKGQDLAINHGTLSGELDEVSGDAVFEGGVDYSLYQMVDENHNVSVSSIQTVSGNQTTKVEMGETAGTLTADASIEVNAEGGTVKVEEGQDGPVEVSGSLADTTVESAGGTISADITGASDVTVTGDTTLSGTNSYSGETLIDGAELKLEAGSSVGTGDVLLTNHGTFDMGGNALSNYIKVTGCTLRGAGAYAGDMDIHDTLDLDGAAQADKVTLIGAGAITGDKLTANALEVQTTGDATVAGDLAINDNGTVTLNDGRVLQVGGSLTLGNGVSLVLNGDYAVGTHLLTGTGSLTLGEVILVCDDTTVELEQQGNSLVLVSLFKLDKAAAVSQANWGIATTSRAFVNTVRGQHSNTGCIADGRGTVWAAAFGSYNDLDGADVDVKGAAVGVDAKVGEHSTLGVAFGYTDGEVSPTGLSDVDQEGTYVALYGEHGLAKLSPTSCLSMDWVAAYGQTDSEWKEMDWKQNSLQLNTRLNWNKKVTNRLCMNVFGGLEYFATESDRTNGVKTGSIQNLRGEIGVGVRYVAWGIPAIAATTDEKGATLAAAQPGCEKLILHGEVRYMNDMVRSNPVVEMDGLRGSGSNPGRQGMGIEAGATYRISERWSASANYGFNTMEDSREHRLNVGASYTF